MVEPNPKQEILLVALRFVLRSMQRLRHHSQGWINEVIEDIDELVKVALAKTNKEIVSIAYLGNVVDVWEKLTKRYSYRFGKRPDLPT
jgi:urocanate hydratase